MRLRARSRQVRRRSRSRQGSATEYVVAGFFGGVGLGGLRRRRRWQARAPVGAQHGRRRKYPGKNGGCKLWQWYEPGTTPYLKQVLNDLVSTVREVKTENSEIRASLANSRAVIDGLVTECNVYEAKSMGQKEECGSFAEMACRIKILEESRRFMLSVIVGFVVVIFALLLLR
uniref:Uncharacterized protein n=1 Tax=Oryza barthii TaxID=65489 RepID=A0A0D3HB59_9ORYZ